TAATGDPVAGGAGRTEPEQAAAARGRAAAPGADDLLGRDRTGLRAGRRVRPARGFGDAALARARGPGSRERGRGAAMRSRGALIGLSLFMVVAVALTWLVYVTLRRDVTG